MHILFTIKSITIFYSFLYIYFTIFGAGFDPNGRSIQRTGRQERSNPAIVGKSF
jgi:hypothetical protein